jgi:hypothetical protein
MSTSTVPPHTNNAGLERRAFDQIDVAEWDRVMSINVRGRWLCVTGQTFVVDGGRQSSRRRSRRTAA